MRTTLRDITQGLVTPGFACAVLSVLVPSSAEETALPRIEWGREEGVPTLTWSNLSNRAFRPWRSEELGQPDWMPLSQFTSDGPTIRWSDESPGLSGFYRLELIAGSNWTSRLQRALDTARANSGARGLVAAAITPDGMWQGTSGFSNPGARTRLQPSQRFSIASITKTFTAALILQLSEEGRLNLDDPIGRWLAAFPNITNTITLRQLLNHTSGVYDFTDNPAYLAWITRTPEKPIALSNVLAWVGAPRFAPGESWEYSSSGFTLLGMVAEAVTGQPAHLELRQRFLEPLALRGTYLETLERATGELAHGFSEVRHKGVLEDVLAWPRTAEYAAAWTSGGMVSTAADVARWMRALYGGSVLKPASLAAMTTWAPASGGASGGTFGLGTMRLHTPMGDFWGHAGSICGYLSCAGHHPGRDVTLVVLVNQDNIYLPAIWNTLVSALE